MNKDGKVEGIYIGEIVSTKDPDMNGRIKVYVPSLHKTKPSSSQGGGVTEEEKVKKSFNCIMKTSVMLTINCVFTALCQMFQF